MSKRSSQRGFVLVTALTLSILYFALMELLLIDSARALGEAQRFRAHIVANVLAENAAELAAFQIVSRSSANVNANDFQGTMHGELQRNSGSFVLTGEGSAIGTVTQNAKVRVEGRLDPDGTIKIDFTVHGE